ncbi:hypothetical protein AB0M28_19580 [Streptomyces sp. NPDC051940]|uniref:hypothetical protein n=1 Tax=Streptomyces sp. NPDC051940 TaxID=3155675 RepID=UPI0034301A63
MHIRTTVLGTAALLLALTGCSSDSDTPGSAADTKPTPSAAAPETQENTGIPPAPTGAERDALLAAIRDVNARLTADEDKAINAARNQCHSLEGGTTTADHSAAVRFSYDGITLSDDDGAHLNIGLRKTLCPET